MVVNRTEGEPASQKDRMLLCEQPHLVLDGAVLAAHAVGRRRCTSASAVRRPMPRTAIESAVIERGRREPGVELLVHATPEHFVVGEETTLIHWLNGGEALPTGHVTRPVERGVNGRPTAVLNCETAAHLTAIINHGASRFRARGTAHRAGHTPGHRHPWRSVVLGRRRDDREPLADVAAAGGRRSTPIPRARGRVLRRLISGREASPSASATPHRSARCGVGAGVLVPCRPGHVVV